MTAQVLSFGISVAVALLMGVAAAIIHFLPGLFTAKWLRWVHYLELPLVFGCAAGLYGLALFGVSLGGLVNEGTTALTGAIGSIVPIVATVVLIGAGIACVALFIHDTIKKQTSARSLVAAVGLPVTLGAIPGAFGSAAVAVFGWLCTALVFGFHSMFSIG